MGGGAMFLQSLPVVLTVVAGVIGILLREPPPRVKALLIVLALLGGFATLANSYYDAQEATKTRNRWDAVIKRAPSPPRFSDALHDSVRFVVADHDLAPLNEPKPDKSGWTIDYDYTAPVTLLKQVGSKSVTDLIVMDKEDRLDFKVNYVSSGGDEETESSREALVCDIRHKFFAEPCFQYQFVRTIASWFWTPQTKITNYDYMLNHFCMIAEELNPQAKNVVIHLEIGDNKGLVASETGCGIGLDDPKNGIPEPLKLTLEKEAIDRVFKERPSRFYGAVYDEFRRQSDKVRQTHQSGVTTPH
jgi:hypothetical protein